MKEFETTELFICQCGDPSHQFIISTDNDTSGASVFISVHLSRESNIFKRIWYAFRYVFGKRSIYGDFDEIIINPADAGRLQKIVDFLKEHQH